MKPNVVLILLFILGGVLGVLLVRAFFLDPVEEIAWRLFWEGIGEGQTIDAGTVLKSATLAKCLAGFVIGGLVAAIISLNFQKNTAKKNSERRDSQNHSSAPKKP